jgi:(p)ppGpp synthase/HD superfamily hydrolase
MPDYNKLLEKALALALKAHKGQKDDNGAPYILHPLRVMEGVRTPVEKIVAILHDVVEDTDYTFKDLRKEGFTKEIIAALDCVTKREGEDYEVFVRRSAGNPIARQVKFADLEDNMRLLRRGEVDKKSLSRLNRYMRAWRYLAER